LKNLVDRVEIQDDSEHADILDDVKSECSQHGSVRMVVIPRTKDGYPLSAEGSVFVEFGDIDSARRAAQSLRGRKFADRLVSVAYVSASPSSLCLLTPPPSLSLSLQYDEIKFSNRVLV
jgi:hypothetical protein